MAPGLVLLPVVLGLAPGCATREFVRSELARSADALAPTVERVASDLQEHRGRHASWPPWRRRSIGGRRR